MAISRTRSHKRFRLDAAKIKRVLDLVISEFKRNRMAAEANERFVQSGIESKDIYGVLEQ
jgi:hypothetical protein